jgi:translation initiation factor 1A
MEFLKFPPWSMFSINPHIIPCAFRLDLLFALVTFHQNFLFSLYRRRLRGSEVHDYTMHLQLINKVYLPYLISNTFLFFYYCLFIQFQIQGFVKLGKRKVLNESYLKEMVMPQSGELFGRVIKLVGGDNIIVKSSDGRVRTCRIRGKIKRKMWIRDNDLVLIAPWDFQSDKADIIWRYISAHADKLEQDGLLQGLR